MGDVRGTLSDALTHVLANPLTTIAGLLNVVMVGGLYFSSLPPGGVIPPKVAGWSTVLSGLARVLLGVMQTDAKK